MGLVIYSSWIFYVVGKFYRVNVSFVLVFWWDPVNDIDG